MKDPVREGLLPGSELNQVVNPIGPVKQRSREFGAEKRPEGGLGGVRETAREFSRPGDLSQVVAWQAEKTKTPGAITLGVWL